MFSAGWLLAEHIGRPVILGDLCSFGRKYRFGVLGAIEGDISCLVFFEMSFLLRSISSIWLIFKTCFVSGSVSRIW